MKEDKGVFSLEEKEKKEEKQINHRRQETDTCRLIRKRT
jgi:hypothetical protein